jgi:hypothetical protein
MSNKKYSRESHGNGFYDVELPSNKDFSKPITGWSLDIHVDPEDLDKAREVLSPYAAEENLNIAYATELSLEQNENQADRHIPTIIVDHTKSMDGKEQEILSNMESMLIDAEVRGDMKSRTEGRPIARSQYMTHRLQDLDNEYGEFPKKEPPANPFANVVISKQMTQSDELDFDFDSEIEQEL